MGGWLALLIVWAVGGLILCLFIGAAVRLAEHRRNRP